MGLTINETVPVFTVLLQGFLSFFSPCVLPLLPLYIGYLSGGTLENSSEGEMHFDQKKVLINTIFFVIGIGFSFFLLGLGMRAIGQFFSGNQLLFARIGGVIILFFGLYQLGVFGPSSILMREKRLPVQFQKMAMSPVTALLMGFVFSFAWTPCVGPTLSGVLLMAASAKSSAAGFALVGVYTLGFALPFLLTGIFTTSVLGFFKKHRNVVKYTVKISGALLILMGILMITGSMNSITGYLSRGAAVGQQSESVGEGEKAEEDTVEEDTVEQGSGDVDETAAVKEEAAPQQEAVKEETAPQQETKSEKENAAEEPAPAEENEFQAPDFTLIDQYGETHTLSDYRGKIVFLNFWATWCPPCCAELPYIQAIYEENQALEDTDLVILGVAFPGHGGEQSEAGIKAFLEENGYTYPVVMDTDGSLLEEYYITAYPTTFMIDPDGNIYGYVPGGMTKATMEDIIRQTREGYQSKE